MRFNPSLAAGLALVSVSAVSAGDTLSVSVSLRNVLHVPPPLAKDSVSMYPSRHPNHDGADVDYLVPRLSRRMYFAQEGHRKAIHGSKHAQMKVIFKHPTVVLDQSDHVTGMKCSNDSIEVCFENPKAREVAENSWVEHTNSGTFHLATYHRGCGDLTGHKRSYFLASQPVRNIGVRCVIVPVQPIDEYTAIESGEISWGTYEDPEERRRGVSNAKGHIRAVAAADGDDDTGTGPDEIVDIDTNFEALERFFNTTDIDPNAPEPEDPIEFMDEDGAFKKRALAKGKGKKKGKGKNGKDGNEGESLSGKVEQGLGKAIKIASNIFKTAKRVVKVVGKIIEVAVEGIKFFYEAFTTGVDRSYHDDYTVNELLKADGSDKEVVILGEKGLSVYDHKKEGSSKEKRGSKFEGDIKISCIKCGMEADFTLNGRFAFHTSTGITAGKLVVDVTKDIKAYAQLGIAVNGTYPLVDWKKQIIALPLSPITIPGVFTVGPQLSFSASFNLDLKGDIELIVGGDVTLTQGKATLDLVNKEDCKIDSGLVPSFEPVAKANGTLQATAALGLPIALEIGVDILNGLFKATAGLIDTPAAYISATASLNKGSPCDAGIELRLGAKNKVELNAFNLWEKEVSNLVIYEKGLGCVTLDGFDKTKVQPDKSDIFNVAKQKFGNKLHVDEDTKLQAATVDPEIAALQRYFSIIMDKAQTATLVSGKDGYLYLAKATEENGLTVAWGTVSPTSGFYSFDSLGRLLGYDSVKYESTKSSIAEIVVSHPKKIQKNNLFAMLVRVPSDKPPAERPVAVFLGGANDIRYATFCKVSGQGLRLYATEYIIDKDGKTLDDDGNEQTDTDDAFTQLGLKKADCRTMYLVSSG